ncbi:MAG TPA: hypothetical protein GX513_09250 [Firmicutes bacterium]|nr:hypothetical protein [Bacillota bacterium]
MNYGEILAYWYLRFNGFIPMLDFVLHRAASDERTSDVDLLAVRLPGVVEAIGGSSEDWDDWFRVCAGVDIAKTSVAVIGEAKTGRRVQARHIEPCFTRDRIALALQRLGLLEPHEPVPNEADAGKHLTLHGWAVLKIAFVELPLHTTTCHVLTLDHVDCFIRRRLRRYNDEKFRDRFFFRDPLIGYLAWSAGHHAGPA